MKFGRDGNRMIADEARRQRRLHLGRASGEKSPWKADASLGYRRHYGPYMEAEDNAFL